MHHIEKVVRTVKGEKKEVDVVFCLGFLTSNPPEIKEINGGYKLMSDFNFSLSVSNGRNASPTYYSLEIWGIQAEHMKKLGFSGQRLAVTGRIAVSTYKGKEYKTLIVERFTCIDRKESQVSVNDNSTIAEVSEKETIGTEDETVSLEIAEKAKESYGDLPF